MTNSAPTVTPASFSHRRVRIALSGPSLLEVQEADGEWRPGNLPHGHRTTVRTVAGVEHITAIVTDHNVITFEREGPGAVVSNDQLINAAHLVSRIEKRVEELATMNISLHEPWPQVLAFLKQLPEAQQ